MLHSDSIHNTTKPNGLVKKTPNSNASIKEHWWNLIAQYIYIYNFPHLFPFSPPQISGIDILNNLNLSSEDSMPILISFREAKHYIFYLYHSLVCA